MTKQLKKQFENQSQTEYMQSNQPQIVSGEEEKQNRIKTQSQSGRSMIEMLGVLAIIAILSIGGIVGYKLAMNYYQAAQIAYEMNMMRTDAKVKITQGTEELLLGDPYDSGHIHFNNYDTDFGCKYVDENDFISEETVSCRIANAYFVELPKIPNGVCQPLTRLINGMDSLIAFYVNGSEYEEGGNCQEGENDLYVIFTAETMSNLTHCEGDNDCESLENTPYCNTNRHVCVECEESNDCEEFEVCDQETGRCVNDCTKGECNSGFCEDGICKQCRNMGDCDNGLACINNQCVTCESESDCEGKHCIDASCVDCTEPTPKYNAAENKCVQCETNEDCLEKGTDKPICNENNECEPCPEGEAWNDEFEECAVIYCATNQECNTNGRNHYYCNFDYTQNCADRSKVQGYCFSKTGIQIDDFLGKNRDMSWESAQNFCASHNMRMLSVTDLKCADKIERGIQGGCHQTSTGTTDRISGNISEPFQQLQQKLGTVDCWISERYDDCHESGILLSNDALVNLSEHRGGHFLTSGAYAVCAP